jgi:metallo-beta-lactamase class B
VIGNVYFVGVWGISSFLIVTPDGAFLLDGALKESAPHIARNITQLGFRLPDVKYLLVSHVHFDHAGGLAELKRRTGAAMVASAEDGRWLAIGGADVPPLAVDRFVSERETIRLGETELTAHITPGHTKGCTTWTMTAVENGRPYDVIFHCGSSIVAPLVNNADDERGFQLFRRLRADVFLEGHPFRWDMERKVRQMWRGGPNPFVDPGEFSRFVDQSEAQFRLELARQRAER